VSDVSTPIRIGSPDCDAGGCDSMALVVGAAGEALVVDGLGDAPPAQPAESRATIEDASNAALCLRISNPPPT
jgi:hypothetical protein